jgi:hypothetical protein
MLNPWSHPILAATPTPASAFKVPQSSAPPSSQDLPTRGLDSARNLCTIAHITVLLAASAAHRTGCPDQLAFVRSFVPNLIDMPPEKPFL